MHHHSRLVVRRVLPLLLPAVVMLTANSAAYAQSRSTPATTPDVLRAMHARYVGKWWKTLTFRQKSMYYEPDGSTRVEWWTEAERAPGSLRVVTEPTADGNVRLYTRDSTYYYEKGALTTRRAGHHPLVVMLSDVYHVEPAVTLRRMNTMLVDTSAFRRETWNGRPMLVMGRLREDAVSREAWIDAERMVIVRLLQSSTAGRFRTLEYRIGGHRPAAGGWLEQWLEMLEDGRRTFREEYGQELVNPTLDPRIFDPDLPPSQSPPIPLGKRDLGARGAPSKSR